MRLATIILSFIIIVSKEPTILTGQVVMVNEPVAYCKVEIMENGASQLTDTDGKFRLLIDNLDEVTLTVTYVERLTSKTIIRAIKLDTNEVDLGFVPLFLNKTISVADFKKLPASEKKKYEEIRHWVELIGYINGNRVDTTAVRANLWDKRKIKYQIDSLDNTVIVNYKDWAK